MKKIALLLTVCVLLLPLAGYADEALYKAKCVACHGLDGKKNAKFDLTSERVQGLSDNDLVKFLTTNNIHKAKVGNDVDAKSVVNYLRTLKK